MFSNGIPYPERQLPAQQMAEIVKETEEIVKEIIAAFSNEPNLGPIIPTISEIMVCYKIEKAFAPPKGPYDKELIEIAIESIKVAYKNCSCTFMLAGVAAIEIRQRLFAN